VAWVTLVVMHGSQDADLSDLFALCDGDHEALGRLYDRHAPVMLALGERILGSRREAEDLLHDVFVEVWQKAGDYDPTRGKVATWMRLRMRSRALDRVRSAVRKEKATEITDRLVGSVNPAEQDGGDRSTLHAALAALPEEQSTVILLSYFAGMSATEIAERVGIPTGTVKSRTAAAMQKLRKALREATG
jgi:RNA polymerase sigma-70 factor (ECF subfamily)